MQPDYAVSEGHNINFIMQVNESSVSTSLNTFQCKSGTVYGIQKMWYDIWAQTKF